MQVKNIIKDLRNMNPDDEIAISYWVREDAETQFGAMDDDTWSEVCDKFGDGSADEVQAILFSISLFEEKK
jgi:hypothetical protein